MVCRVRLALCEVLRPKALGKQLPQGVDAWLAVGPPEYDAEAIKVAELAHDLPADAAWSAILWRGLSLGSANDCDGIEAAMAVVDSLEERRSLGTVGGCIGGVLYVASTVDRAIGAKQGGTNRPVGVGGVCVLSRLECSSNQRVVVHGGSFQDRYVNHI